MPTGPFLGVLLHAIGGFAAGSFYAPLKQVRRWAWESFWLVMGMAAWLVTPWVVALVTIPHLVEVLLSSPATAIGWAIFFGLLWGVGNLTFGLSVRYLGMALGYAVALGFCMIFGTLVPPIVDGKLGSMLGTASGLTILGGVAACLGGIGICGRAGMRKEAELTDEEKKQTVAEFALGKGFAVATMAGILSACFAFGLKWGKPIGQVAIEHGAPELYSNNAVLVVILIGGFVSNVVWCLFLNARNRSFGDYVTGPALRQLRNYLLSALGGVIWYGQFFFYGMGTTKLGEKYDFSSWSIHMAFIIVFSNLWGLYFREWHGTSRRTNALVWAGIATLIASTIVIGYGNYLAGM
ncbi:MAG TPA: L-rhamnose/proton symporter RhaT [Thermoguttaceae bacterium]|nr:L-rhamnose/proton symporter RhaT [Thermoguttaceae bacterium]